MTYATVTKTMPKNGQFIYSVFDAHTVASDAWETLGYMETWGLVKKRIKIQVTGHNASIRLYGYQDPSKTLAPLLVSSFTILAGDDHTILIEAMYAAMRIDVHNTVNGEDPVIQVYFAGDNSEHTPVRSSMAHETITVTNGAGGIGLTRDTLDSALECIITCESNPVRFWLDGTAPTTTVGHLLSSGDTLKITSTVDMLNALFIATGANATLSVSYSR